MSNALSVSYQPEDKTIRRSVDRSEDPSTLDEQLDAGLEDSFPASDPISVTSPTITGKATKLVGTDEVLAQRRAARATAVEQRQSLRKRAEGLTDPTMVLATGGLIAGIALAVGSLVWLTQPRP